MYEEIKKISVFRILNQALVFVKTKTSIFVLFSLINLIFLLLFRYIDGGLSNKISILWMLSYYFYWFVFFRVYYNKQPYLFSKDIFGSFLPSTKMFFLVIAMSLFLGVLPYLPLLMGFNDKYLLLLENYMQQLQAAPMNTLNMLVLLIIFMLFSPFILCRPFLAFIASVQGLNGSLRKAWKKSIGNYWQFIFMMCLLNLPCMIIYEADNYLDCNGCLILLFYSFFFVYYNLVFAKLYDFFYME